MLVTCMRTYIRLLVRTCILAFPMLGCNPDTCLIDKLLLSNFSLGVDSPLKRFPFLVCFPLKLLLTLFI